MKSPYLDKKVSRLVGKAIWDYRLIEDGDKILVALSGGKDSVALLKLLCERRKFVPIDYEIKALTVDLGFGKLDLSRLRSFVEGKRNQHVSRPQSSSPAHS